ncbi:hypothetical protein BVX93_00080 [bacterium B13(2017)]|nr:hypothetical protein BVX93_00080 [bacterium B13(2017)]
MKLAVLAMGSRGDVQPLIGLSMGLQNAGYKVRFASHPNFEKMAIDAGLEFHLIPINPVEVLESDEGKAAMEQGGNPIKSIKAFVNMMYPHMMTMSKSCFDACNNVDAIISPTFGNFVVPHINETLKLPTITALFQPTHPTAAYPSYLLSQWDNKPGFINKLSWTFFDILHWLPLKGWINDYRTQHLNLPKLPFFQVTSRRTANDAPPTLYGFSSSIFPKQKEWGDNVHVTGYWFLNANKDWTPPHDLSDFLKNGPPPIYIGFGSMSTRSSDKTTEIILKAFEKTGQRGLMAKGWGGIQNKDLPDSIFLIDSALPARLIRKMPGVIHPL